MTADDNTINDNTISQLSEFQRRTLEVLRAPPGQRVRIAVLTAEQTAGDAIGGHSRVLRQILGGTFIMTTNPEPGTWRASTDDRHYLIPRYSPEWNAIVEPRTNDINRRAAEQPDNE